MASHEHTFVRFHADHCHFYEDGETCDCGERRSVLTHTRDFRRAASAWWHWGRAGCVQCEELMREAGLHPRALADEDLACAEIERQLKEAGANDGKEKEAHVADTGPKYPDVTVELSDQNGNAFSILARVERALRRANVPQEERKAFRDEATAADYDHLLRTAMKWVDVS